MIWLILFIPLFATFFLWRRFKDEILIWEAGLNVAIPILLVFTVRIIVSHSLTVDTQFKGGIATEARYYEYWDTWITKECSYDCNCETDEDGHRSCDTCYKDCSYCEEHQPEWIVKDNIGREFEINEAKWKSLVVKWKVTPKFNDLGRDIDTHFGCGKDGDMYSIKWDNEEATAEPTVAESNYINRVQNATSAFNLKKIEEKEAIKLGLYKYPPIYDFYKQNSLLGGEKLTCYKNKTQLANDIKSYEYLNGKYGNPYKVKTFVLLFVDKPLSIVAKQEAYWERGNQNEIVTCIGLDSNGKINWVKAFTWSDNTRIPINLREDIMQLKYWDAESVKIILTNEIKNFKYKNLDKDFQYLKPVLPTWSIIVILILTLLSTVGISYWVVKNEHTN